MSLSGTGYYMYITGISGHGVGGLNCAWNRVRGSEPMFEHLHLYQ